jgi:glycosyltransferase involved in cell wall biosynthesis
LAAEYEKIYYIINHVPTLNFLFSMNIILITNTTPASENIRGTSALPYHLLVYRPKDVTVTVYSLNYNNLSADKIAEVENELGVKIIVIKKSHWINFVLKSKIGVIIRVLLSYPIFNYIKLKPSLVKEISGVDDIQSVNKRPDGIFIYGEEMSRVSHQFAGFKRIHLLPDCESLYYYRMLGLRFVFSHRLYMLRHYLMYRKYLRMERHFDNNSDVKYMLVGDADAQFLREIDPGINAIFMRHPHYNIAEPQKMISFAKPKIRLLIAGQHNLYMQQSGDELVEALCNIKGIQEHYCLTFLGRGWEKGVDELKAAGYDVKQIRFAPDYIDEIRRHDIQITPITIGTGTKGKVLDALANGLLEIGTPYALENIAVEDGRSCLIYHSPKELINILKDIHNDISRYEAIAEAGRKDVLEQHNRKKVSSELFELFRNYSH